MQRDIALTENEEAEVGWHRNGDSSNKKIEDALLLASNHDNEIVAGILGTLLSDEVVLYTKTRNHHWNVVEQQFNGLHKFFDAQYISLNDIVDQVAERARTIGNRAFGTLTEFMLHTTLKESPGAVLNASDMIAHLLADHESVIKKLKVDIVVCERHHDLGTTDFLIGLMEQHERMAWMLRSFQETI